MVLAPTKEQLYQIMGAYGLGRVLPAGSTRRAVKAFTRGVVKAGRIIVPRAAATAAIAARRHPYSAAALAGYGAYEAGLLDAPIQAGQDIVEERVIPVIQRTKKRAKSKFNKAVAKGMAVVKASSHNGRRGSFGNSRKAFATVTKTVSALNKGGKLPKSGIRRKIGLAVRKIL